MAETIGIIGQAVLVVMSLVLLAALVFFVLVIVRTCKRVARDIWPAKPIQPYTDAYLPEPFDQMRRN
jgi:hypothetical protein